MVSAECLFVVSQDNLFWFLDEALRLKPGRVCCFLLVDTLFVKGFVSRESLCTLGVEILFFSPPCVMLCHQFQAEMSQRKTNVSDNMKNITALHMLLYSILGFMKTSIIIG